MLKNLIELMKDELYALKTRPKRREIENALKDPNSIYSINLAKFVVEQKTKSHQ